MTMPNLVEMIGIEAAVAPKDITGAAQPGDWMSLKYYSHLTVILVQGAWAGGTAAVTLQQALDVAGGTPKALAFDKLWTKVGLGAGSQFSTRTVTNNSFTLPGVANTITVIEIDGDDLDVTNGYDCVQVNVGTPGAFTDLLSVLYLLSGARYPQAAMPDAKTN